MSLIDNLNQSIASDHRLTGDEVDESQLTPELAGDVEKFLEQTINDGQTQLTQDALGKFRKKYGAESRIGCLLFGVEYLSKLRSQSTPSIRETGELQQQVVTVCPSAPATVTPAAPPPAPDATPVTSMGDDSLIASAITLTPEEQAVVAPKLGKIKTFDHWLAEGDMFYRRGQFPRAVACYKQAAKIAVEQQNSRRLISALERLVGAFREATRPDLEVSVLHALTSLKACPSITWRRASKRLRQLGVGAEK